LQQEQSLFSFIRGGQQQVKNEHEVVITKDSEPTNALEGRSPGSPQPVQRRNTRLNRKHEIFNKYLGQFCNHESQGLSLDQTDAHVLADLNPPTEEPMLENHPEDAEASNEEESVGDENEPLPQNAGEANANARPGSSANTGR